MLKRDVVQAIFAPVALLLSLQAGCESRGDGDILELREEQPGLPRSATWGEYRATRHERTGREVVSRARLIATIVLQDDQLPSVSLLPQSEIDEWEASARSDPYREGAIRFKLGGRDVLARYRPATDRLSISAMDTRVRPASPAHLDPGIGSERVQHSTSLSSVFRISKGWASSASPSSQGLRR